MQPPWTLDEDVALLALFRAHGSAGWRGHLASVEVLAARSLTAAISRLSRLGAEIERPPARDDPDGPPWPARGEPWPADVTFFAGHDSRRAALDRGSPRYELLPPEPLFGQSALRSALARYVR